MSSAMNIIDDIDGDQKRVAHVSSIERESQTIESSFFQNDSLFNITNKYESL